MSISAQSLQQQVASGHLRDDDNGIIPPVEDSFQRVSFFVFPEMLKC